MIERLKRWLRGDYNSIRYRFFILPVGWLTYLFRYRLFGKSWIDYYAARLDSYKADEIFMAPNKTYLESAEDHLIFLKRHGLNPSHRLLDYGCGIMRSGIYFARYLDKGNYVGADISGARLAYGRQLMNEVGLSESDYEVVIVHDCHLDELKGRRFDIIWANSVLTHMPEDDIRTMLHSMAALLAQDGRFYFTFSEAETRKRKNIKDFWYPAAEMRGFFEKEGYTFEIVDNYAERSDVMACARLRSQTAR